MFRSEAVNRDELLRRVERLGREFARRKMVDHVKILRVYYLALQRNLTSPGLQLDVHWNAGLTDEWWRVWRWDPGYDVRPRASQCRKCLEKSHPTHSLNAPLVALVFPGGFKIQCNGCGDAWLELADANSSSPPIRK